MWVVCEGEPKAGQLLFILSWCGQKEETTAEEKQRSVEPEQHMTDGYGYLSRILRYKGWGKLRCRGLSQFIWLLKENINMCNKRWLHKAGNFGTIQDTNSGRTVGRQFRLLCSVILPYQFWERPPEITQNSNFELGPQSPSSLRGAWRLSEGTRIWDPNLCFVQIV